MFAGYCASFSSIVVHNPTPICNIRPEEEAHFDVVPPEKRVDVGKMCRTTSAVPKWAATQ